MKIFFRKISYVREQNKSTEKFFSLNEKWRLSFVYASNNYKISALYLKRRVASPRIIYSFEIIEKNCEGKNCNFVPLLFFNMRKNFVPSLVRCAWWVLDRIQKIELIRIMVRAKEDLKMNWAILSYSQLWKFLKYAMALLIII